MQRHQVLSGLTSAAFAACAVSTALPWRDAVNGLGMHFTSPGYDHSDGQIVAVVSLVAALLALVAAVEPSTSTSIAIGALDAVAGLILCTIAMVDFDDVVEFIGIGYIALCVLAPTSVGLAIALVVTATETKRAPDRTASPQWAADPQRRAELRWWDGTRWTEHVQTGTHRGIDPF